MFKLNGEYYDRIMNILALRKNELEEYLEEVENEKILR